MSDEAPAAPASAAPAEPSAPITPAPEAAPAPAPEQPAQAPVTAPVEGASNNYFTNDQLTEMQRFIENNGGYDKAWARMKEGISRPQPQPEAPQAPSTPQMPQQPTQAPQAPQNGSQEVRAGSYSLEEIAAQQYFDRLASEEKYASIANEIRSGEVLKGLRDFNINPISDGRVNDGDIRKYLDLYAATKPATQTSVTPQDGARVDYYNVPDEKAMTYEQATQIELQNVRLRAAGQPEHPLTARAKEVVKAHFAPKK